MWKHQNTHLFRTINLCTHVIVGIHVRLIEISAWVSCCWWCTGRSWRGAVWCASGGCSCAAVSCCCCSSTDAPSSATETGPPGRRSPGQHFIQLHPPHAKIEQAGTHAQYCVANCAPTRVPFVRSSAKRPTRKIRAAKQLSAFRGGETRCVVQIEGQERRLLFFHAITFRRHRGKNCDLINGWNGKIMSSH